MKSFWMCLLGLAVLSGCGHDEVVPDLLCGGYDVQMAISDDGESMHANINGDELEMKLVVSASGAKYSGTLNDIVVVLWEKSGTWTMMLDDEQIIDCRGK